MAARSMADAIEEDMRKAGSKGLHVASVTDPSWVLIDLGDVVVHLFDAEHREFVKKQIDIKLSFLTFAEKHPISALHGSGVGKLFDVVHSLYESTMIDMSTPLLTRILNDATSAHQPPLVGTRRIKLKYAHQGGRNPPVVVIHGVQTDSLPGAYKSYLMNYFREQLKLKGTPVRLVFKSPENPFHDQTNKLTEHQAKKRRRLIVYRKSRQK